MDLVPPDEIERIVGVKRDDFDHYGIAASDQEVFYILHSRMCRESRDVLEIDLRDCPYSIALNEYGIDSDEWVEDQPCELFIRDGRLVPSTSPEEAKA